MNLLIVLLLFYPYLLTFLFLSPDVLSIFSVQYAEYTKINKTAIFPPHNDFTYHCDRKTCTILIGVVTKHELSVFWKYKREGKLTHLRISGMMIPEINLGKLSRY